MGEHTKKTVKKRSSSGEKGTEYGLDPRRTILKIMTCTMYTSCRYREFCLHLYFGRELFFSVTQQQDYIHTWYVWHNTNRTLQCTIQCTFIKSESEGTSLFAIRMLILVCMLLSAHTHTHTHHIHRQPIFLLTIFYFSLAAFYDDYSFSIPLTTVSSAKCNGSSFWVCVSVWNLFYDCLCAHTYLIILTRSQKLA